MSSNSQDQRLDEMRAWIERVASYFTRLAGWPPITGRTLGWLLVCEPPEQSAAEIAAAIQASRASLTGTLRLLVAGGLVETSHRPGSRTAYYRLADDAWITVTRRRFAAMSEFNDLTLDGLKFFSPGAPEARRLEATNELIEWTIKEIEPIWERWDAQRKRRSTRAGDGDWRADQLPSKAEEHSET